MSVNPATLLPTPEDGEAHNCAAVFEKVCTPRPDLSDMPLSNPDMFLFVDGSGDPATAKLVALTVACKLAAGKSVTIYTDSRYAFGVVHDFGVVLLSETCCLVLEN